MKRDFATVALLHNLWRAAPVLSGEALQAPVVDDRQAELGQAAHQEVDRSCIAGAGERRNQLGHAAIEDGSVLASGLVGERISVTTPDGAKHSFHTSRGGERDILPTRRRRCM